MKREISSTEAVHATVRLKNDDSLWDCVFYRVFGVPTIMTMENNQGDFECQKIDADDEECVAFVKGIFDEYDQLNEKK